MTDEMSTLTDTFVLEFCGFTSVAYTALTKSLTVFMCYNTIFVNRQSTETWKVQCAERDP